MPKVIVVTTSMGTKWEAYSQTMLALKVPEWQRHIVDGRFNWSPTKFIEYVINKDSDYIIHVDEDCFVQSRDALLDIIKEFQIDNNVVAAGIPDGGCYYRDHNPAALNLFFVAFRTSALRKAWNERNKWHQLKFHKTFMNEVMLQRSDLDKSRINWDEAEPYYPLFWSLLSHGGRFLYLKEELFKPRWSSRVFMPSGHVIVEHMWYLRQWFSKEIMPGHDCSNSTRYNNFVTEWHLMHDGKLKPNLILGFMHFKRIIRRFTK